GWLGPGKEPVAGAGEDRELPLEARRVRQVTALLEVEERRPVPRSPANKQAALGAPLHVVHALAHRGRGRDGAADIRLRDLRNTGFARDTLEPEPLVIGREGGP